MIRGYFIQDFEPYFYPPDSDSFKTAWTSYTLIPDLVCFATTKWIQGEVIRQTGARCGLVGGCFDSNLFRPRPRPGPEWPQRPLRIVAMIRPETPYRAPRLTMEVLRAISRHYGSQIEVFLFGTENLLDLPQDFPWRLAGRLEQYQVAEPAQPGGRFCRFLNISGARHHGTGGDGLWRRCGCSRAWRHGRIRPERGELPGGRHVLPQACEDAVRRLIEDHDLRTRLQRNAMFDVSALYPERPAYNILSEPFTHGSS